MSAAPDPTSAAAQAVEDARALTQRLSRSLGIPTGTSLLDRARPRAVAPALSRLFAHGGLPHGEVVQMGGRSALSLGLACCAATTQDGGWCAGIGLGEPAVAAMRDLGVELSRFVCLDTPAQDWMRVASILLESFDVLLVDPGFSAAAGERARIAAKLRDSRATLILLEQTSASFPGSTENLTVLGESWEGTHEGAGRLQRRRLRVRSARTGEHTLVLPDPQGAAADPAAPTNPAAPTTPAAPVPAGTPRAGALRLVRPE